MSLGTRTSIRIALPALICLLVVLTVGALAAIIYPRIETELGVLARQNLTRVHARIQAQLDQHFGVAERINAVNREIIGSRAPGWSEMQNWRDTFFNQLLAFETISNMVWGDVDGNALFVGRHAGAYGFRFGIAEGAGGLMEEYRLDGGGGQSTEPVARYPYDPRERPWYEDALAAGTPAWGRIYRWTAPAAVGPILGIPYVAPLHDGEGELLGVISVEFSLLDVSRFLTSLDIGGSGLAYIMDAQGLLVANSVGIPVMSPAGDRRALAAEVDHPLVAASARAISDGLMGGMIPSQPFYDSLNFDGVDMLFMATPFLRAGDLRWLVVTLVPEEAFLGGFHASRRHSIAAAIVAVLLALLTGIAVGTYISRPIVRLSEHVRLIGRGELGHHIDLREFPEFVRLSVAINRMTEGLRERLKLRESLAMAMEVQQRLLPSAIPRIQGLDIAGYSAYCDETGGDYFDYLQLDRHRDGAVVAIGDVSGHGIASAMVMASARGILRSRSHDATSLAELLAHMNRQISEDSTGGRFMTMLLVMISAVRRQLRWASAGHRPPLVYDPEDDRFEELDGADAPLGVLPEVGYREFDFSGMGSGSIVLLATDGLWEADNAEGEPFGLRRIHDHLRRYASRSAEEIARTLAETVAAFRGAMTQNDDVTFVVVKITE